DVAWMGPWGYVLAHHEGGARAIATVKYDGRPFYHAIILSRPGLTIDKWPDGAKGLRISFADVGSTSGWLIPTHYFRSRGIDPKTFFQYRDGASHPANVTAVANSQVDLATDFDRNFNGMAERGLVRREDVKIAWQSDPLPNDPLVVRSGFDAATRERIQEIVTGITEDEAKTIMPKHYTGWVKADHASYRMIEDAGVAVGRLKPKA
ncbi:MAG: phosphate/phosphite/phosphonate ABC transporter substrate-binding protein, partial [Beijerinckiaceae bacterium]